MKPLAIMAKIARFPKSPIGLDGILLLPQDILLLVKRSKALLRLRVARI